MTLLLLLLLFAPISASAKDLGQLSANGVRLLFLYFCTGQSWGLAECVSNTWVASCDKGGLLGCVNRICIAS